MLGQEGSVRILRPFLVKAGYVVLAVWCAAMIGAFLLRFLGFPVPEILVSQEFALSAVGFSYLQMILEADKRGTEEKAHPIICAVLGFILGTALIIYFGLFMIMLGKLNIFTCLCLIIGTAIIFFNANRLRRQLADSGKLWRKLT